MFCEVGGDGHVFVKNPKGGSKKPPETKLQICRPYALQK